MKIVIDMNQLPEKIKSCIVENYTASEQAHIFSFKTSYKPNPTIPILWFVQLTDRITFCNTHKTRGIYKEIMNNSVNSIRICPSSLGVEIIYEDLNEDDFALTVEKTCDFNLLKEKLVSAGFEVITGR